MNYYPVTKEELEQIRCACLYPGESCSGKGCEHDDPVIGCSFDPASVIEEVSTRSDPLEILKKWAKPNLMVGDTLLICKFIKQLRENPEAAQQEGIRDGWWKE